MHGSGSLTAIMIIRYSVTRCTGSVSYAIHLYIDRSYYHLLHRSPSQSKRYVHVAIKAYRTQGCAKLCHGQTESLAAPGLLVCLSNYCCNWLYIPANAYCGSRLGDSKSRLLQANDYK
jgi:hypothetical protein